MRHRAVDPRGWPLAVQSPVLVVVLMPAIGLAVSGFVLGKLAQLQEAHLRQLAAAYLEGVGITVTPLVERRDI
jgi:hypothetical protein